MTDAVAQSVVKLVESRFSELRELTITWFGGEPLLSMGTIRTVMRGIREVKLRCDGNLPKVSSNISTNAVFLTPRVLEELISMGIQSFQVTFDGDLEAHDSFRIGPSGQGTFRKIMTNLRAAHRTSLQFLVTLRLHSNAINESSLRGLLRRVADEFKDDTRFQIFIRPLSRLGGPYDHVLPICHDTVVVDRLRLYASELGLSNDIPSADEICYAAELNSFVIRPDGHVGKCTVALYDPRNTVGELDTEGRLVVDTARVIPWVAGLFGGTRSDRRCPLRRVQNGWPAPG